MRIEDPRPPRVLIYAPILSCAGAFFGLFYLLSGVGILGIPVLVAVALIAFTPLVLRLTRSPLAAGNWLQLHMLWAICWGTYFSGAPGGLMVWFVLLPLLGLLVNGPRVGIAWAGISLGCLSIFCALDLAGHPFPNVVDEPTANLVKWASLLLVTAVGIWVVMIYERQQEKSNAELREALDRADAASRVKSAFLANTSHELRTPMNGVVGMTSLLMTTELTHEQREYVETIHESSESLLSVIDDILDFSQLDANKLKLTHVEFDLRERLETTIALLGEQVGQKPLDLVSIVDQAVPERLIGDPVRFNQVVSNLVDNALKFTDAGEVVVEVRLANAEGALVELSVSVSDTGIGIALEDQERIFERFMQLDTSTARRYGGTGLGLAISKQVVERMQGRISVKSELGRGSTFTFTATFERGGEPERRSRRPRTSGAALIGPMGPGLTALLEQRLTARGLTVKKDTDLSHVEELDLVVVDLDRTEVRGPRVIGLSRAKIEGALPKPVRASQLDAMIDRVMSSQHKAPGKILVVEDNAVNQLVAATMIQRLGYAVEVAGSGTEALVRCQENEYGAIVMDCHMPGMDGFETATEIRRRGKRTPIIALTASAASEYRARCLDAGMDDFLTKPVEIDIMQTMLSRWVAT
jgi:signal transduction histidine kinase/CheY-like chemotaxis protein